MATTTLTFPSAVTTLTITSVTRTDLDTDVPATLTGSGTVWTLTITDPSPGLTYDYALFATYPDGSSNTLTGTKVGAGAPVGYYWTLATLQTLDGTINLAIESNLDNRTLAGDYARIQSVGDDGDAWHDQAWMNANSGRTMPIGLTAGDYRQSSRIVTKWIVGRLMLARQNSSSATKHPLNTFQAEAENELSAMIWAYMQRGEFPQGPSDFENSRPIQYYPPTPTRGWPYGVW